MNKVICDVCGTAYPETASQCPICGCAKAGADQTAAGDTLAGEQTSYSYTRGGHFSRQNVRRRSRKAAKPAKFAATASKEEEQTNIGLIAVVIVLLLAIIAVVVYIGVKFFAIGADNSPIKPTDDALNRPSQSETLDQTEYKNPCTSLDLSNKTIEFRAAGDAWLIETLVAPQDTTDTLSFVSADEAVAIVSDSGLVTAVGGGETVITVTCGAITQECRIVCSFESIQTPTDGTNEGGNTGVVDPNFVFKFNAPEKYYDPATGKWDTTISEVNGTWRAYKNDLTVNPADITWTSDNPEIAKIENGIVTAVAPGKTEVHAQYGGKTYTCIVRCSFKATDKTETTDKTESADGKYTISSTDMTIKKGEFWWLKLNDSNGKAQEVTWTADHDGYVKIEGNKLTGIKNTGDLKMKYVTVSCTYEDVKYSCVVRISG